MTKIHILAIAAHPDDAEMSCGATLWIEKQKGKSTGILDLTKGELGTRGTPETRKQELTKASEVLQLDYRHTLDLGDGFFQNSRESQLQIIQQIRKIKPDLVLCNAIHDRHPDHGKGAQLAHDACFLSGLKMIETKDENGHPQEHWRPKKVYHYIQDRYIHPDVVVDISSAWKKKMEAVNAFSSQFFDPNSKEPETYISTPAFLSFLEARAREMGHAIGAEFGEGFTLPTPIGAHALSDLFF